MVVFYNILDISAINAFIVWTQMHPKWNETVAKHRRRLFIKELGMSLIKNQMQSRLSIPGLSLPLRQLIEECLRDPNDNEIEGGSPTAADESQGSENGDGACVQPKKRPARKRARCNLCPRKNDIKTRTVCSICSAHVCEKHCSVVCATCK